MAYDYSNLCAEIQNWAEQSVKAGWIDESQATSLLDEKTESANSLFSNQVSRPLVVAFLGGTGVGKSSLLNKLAGQAIATAGIERPTSREVTLFHHQSLSLNQLEQQFPLQQIKIAQHSESANEKIIWIDMPDFDSTEEKNKAIVMQWLPYIDVLVYVVSPERYRDSKAWQLLLSEGSNHAWLFALNQWDKGETAQYEDFKQQLAKANFDEPLIYKTSCVDESENELSKLLATIQSLANDNTIEQLEQRDLKQRKDKLQSQCLTCLEQLGNERILSGLLVHHCQAWQQTEEILGQGFNWPIKQAAMRYSSVGTVQKNQPLTLWDEWAQSRFNDYLDDLVLTANQQGLPANPLRKQLSGIRTKAEKIIHTQAELACRKSLVNPGNAVQRLILKTANVSEIILPLLAMSVVGVEVFQGYYDSSFTDEAFLGVNFAVHSVLLVLISWLFPYFLRKKMQPSLEKSALKGLNKGLSNALIMIKSELDNEINHLKTHQQERITTLKQIITMCQQQEHSNEEGEGAQNPQLTKMLIDKH